MTIDERAEALVKKQHAEIIKLPQRDQQIIADTMARMSLCLILVPPHLRPLLGRFLREALALDSPEPNG